MCGRAFGVRSRIRDLGTTYSAKTHASSYRPREPLSTACRNRLTLMLRRTRSPMVFDAFLQQAGVTIIECGNVRVEKILDHYFEQKAPIQIQAKSAKSFQMLSR